MIALTLVSATEDPPVNLPDVLTSPFVLSNTAIYPNYETTPMRAPS